MDDCFLLIGSPDSQMAKKGVPTATYRIEVGQRRRATTEGRILEAAVHVFAAKGPDAPTIDDFIKAAGIARGTFYNYFKSTRELLAATSRWLTDDLVESIEKEISVFKDPTIRHGMGLRYWMRKAEADPPWCSFVAATWFRGGFAEAAPMRNMRLGVKRGSIRCTSLMAAYDLSMGTMRQAMIRLGDEPQLRGRGYDDEVVRSILVGLSVSAETIANIMNLPVIHMRRPTRTVA
jgi:AcrR family transcriptional regulator